MRVFTGDAKNIYQIHKMYLEYLTDTEQGIPEVIKKDLFMWVPRFSDSSFFVKICMHGRLNVGMCWGRVSEKVLGQMNTEKRVEVEGVFIRRGFRGRLKPIKKLMDGLNDVLCSSNAVAISTVVSQNQLKRATRKGFKVSGLIVEKRLGANK